MPADPQSPALLAGLEAIEISTKALAELPARFAAAGPAAVELILGRNGRVIVSGLGKSGLVGAKLAATLASTGTPSHFVHAADALHGDAGTIGADDVLLAISCSGRTSEVVAVAELAVERGVPVIAMTGCDGTSALASLAAVHLDIGVERESDPHDLAPTASTTTTIVFGDALACALMAAREFGPADFHRHHPTGALGQRLAAGGPA